MKASEILANILDLLRGELGDGFSSVRTFAQNQSENIAELAVVIARERVSGVLRTNNQMFHRFVDRLKRHVEIFARDLAMLTVLTIERAWNLVVGEVWGAINAAISGIGLPLQLPPPPQQQ